MLMLSPVQIYVLNPYQVNNSRETNLVGPRSFMFDRCIRYLTTVMEIYAYRLPKE